MLKGVRTAAGDEGSSVSSSPFSSYARAFGIWQYSKVQSFRFRPMEVLAPPRPFAEVTREGVDVGCKLSRDYRLI